MLNHKTIKTILLALCLVSLAGAGGKSKIVGKVIDDSTGKPLTGVNVIVEGTEYGASTDQHGDYVILFMPPGEYKVTAGVGYLGYEKKTQLIVMGVNQRVRLDFRLKPIKIDTAQFISTIPRITYAEADTSLPEKYVRKKLFELNWGNGPGEIGRLPEGSIGPGGLAVDDSGNIHILAMIGPGQLRIVVFDSTGRFLHSTDITYEWKKIMESGLGTPVGNGLTYLGIDSQGNYLIASNMDEYLYTFDRNGNYITRDTTEYLGANLLYSGKGGQSLKREQIKTGNAVTIGLRDINTNLPVIQLSIQPRKWIVDSDYPYFNICNVDKNGNCYVLITASEKESNEGRYYYCMVNKYAADGKLLAEIPVRFEECEEARVYVTTNGEIYVLTYYTRCPLPNGRFDYPDKKTFVSKWVLQR